MRPRWTRAVPNSLCAGRCHLSAALGQFSGKRAGTIRFSPRTTCCVLGRDRPGVAGGDNDPLCLEALPNPSRTAHPSLRGDQRPDLPQPLLADPLDPIQFVHRPIGPTLDDSPGDHRPDPRQGLLLRVRRRVEMGRAAGPSARLPGPRQRVNDLSPTAGTSDDDPCREGFVRSLATGSLGRHPSAEMPAASGIGKDSSRGVDFSRFVAFLARRSRFGLPQPAAWTSCWPRGGEQARLSSERQ